MTKRIAVLLLALAGVSLNGAQARKPAPEQAPATIQPGTVLGGRTVQLAGSTARPVLVAYLPLLC